MFGKKGLALVAFAAALLGGCTAPANQSGVLNLSGQLVTGQREPIAGETFRLVFGSDTNPRGATSGHMVTTDDEGRFALSVAVTRKGRTITLDNIFARHPSLLLEIGFELGLLGRPALYWVEFDFTQFGPVRGIATYVPDDNGNFAAPIIFRDHTWSFPDDPSGMRFSGTGADVEVNEWEDPEGGPLMLDLYVIRHVYTPRE